MPSGKNFGKERLYLVIIIALAALAAYMFFQNTIATSSQQAVTENVLSTYKNLTESDAEVLSVKDEGNLYKILLRLKLTDGDVLREVYATKDGRYFSENVIDVADFNSRLVKERDFAECLKTKGLIVLGQKSEPNTLQQLLIIGNFANKVYVECSGANLQACQQLGIQMIPTIIYNKMNYTGVQTREWIESLTGCKY